MVETETGGTAAVTDERRFIARMFVWLTLAAVGTRVLFWVVTRRTWEDAYITITPVRTFFHGGGLTHHSSEPHIHSFTSVVSMAVPFVGELVSQPLLALRIAALVSCGVTMWLARELVIEFKLSRAAAFLFGGYLAFDQLQVFLGISGMETQMAVAAALAIVLAMRRRNTLWLGIACGVGMLTRPDFLVFPLVIVGFQFLRREYRSGLKVGAIALGVVAPWVVFATAYYGSPIPNTIRAKNLYPTSGLSYHPGFHELSRYVRLEWKALSPFWQNDLVLAAPLPQQLAKLFVAVLLGFVLYAAWRRRTDTDVLALGVIVAIFFAYRSRALLSTYFMWYLPPFVAIIVLLASLGVEDLRGRFRRVNGISPLLAAASVVAVAMFAVPTFLSLPIERRVQRDVEVGVRERVGRYLKREMGPNDTVVLEPVGYIGYFAGDVTTIDYPGLTSKIATSALRRLPQAQRSVAALVATTKPSWAVLRPEEWADLQNVYGDVAARYRLSRRFSAPATLSLRFAGMEYRSIDREFLVLHRI